MESQKRGPGRPRKAEPTNGPVVLTLSKKREKLEIELTTPTRCELDDYVTWVEECEPELDPGELWFTTSPSTPSTTLLRTDKRWRERQRALRAGNAKEDEAPPTPDDTAKQSESGEINPGAHSVSSSNVPRSQAR